MLAGKGSDQTAESLLFTTTIYGIDKIQFYHLSPVQTEKSQSGKLETTFTESVPALSVDPRVGLPRSASETFAGLFFLPMTSKSVIYHPSFLSFLTSYVA